MFTAYGVFTDYKIDTFSLLIGIVGFGIIIPLLSNIGPAQLALAKNLRNSLDQTRQSGQQDGIKVETKRLSDYSMSVKELILGVSLTLFGFIVYYLTPWSLYQDKIALFFSILNVVVGFEALFGATLITSTLQPYI